MLSAPLSRLNCKLSRFSWSWPCYMFGWTECELWLTFAPVPFQLAMGNVPKKRKWLLASSETEPNLPWKKNVGCQKSLRHIRWRWTRFRDTRLIDRRILGETGNQWPSGGTSAQSDFAEKDFWQRSASKRCSDLGTFAVLAHWHDRYHLPSTPLAKTSACAVSVSAIDSSLYMPTGVLYCLLTMLLTLPFWLELNGRAELL